MRVRAGVCYDEVKVGDQLPPLVVPLTRTLIISTALASRDYQDVHHDPDLARRRGSPDIFMNILTTNGFVGRFITDWAGPNTLLRSVKIRLGAPNYPGDTMTLTGEVTSKIDGLIEVAVRGTNSLGDHVTGTVTLEIPEPTISRGEAAPDPDGKGLVRANGTKSERRRDEKRNKRVKKAKKKRAMRPGGEP